MKIFFIRMVHFPFREENIFFRIQAAELSFYISLEIS